ncbi:MAG: hypothetical protein H6534_05120 [Chthonomonadaceae bacterium]|nr:hypothetical protein [Chthonomonadaceae bacterium]
MRFSKSIVLANVSLLIGIAAFCAVPLGCSGKSGEEEVSAPHDASKSAVAGGEAGESHEAEEATEHKDHEAGEAPEAAGEEKAESGMKVAANVQPCVKCHSGQAKAHHVVEGVSCVTCHMDTEAHLKSPKTHPKTPSERADCFKCHAESAKVMANAPKQPDTHGEKEPCVSCHTIHDA